MSGATDTFGPGGARDGTRGPEWSLAVALDCERLDAPPMRLVIERTAEVEIGRGDERKVERAQGRLRLELPDRWASRVHARLTRAGEGWIVEDAGSKNGTWVDGEQVERAEVADGSVIECGGTFLVLRRSPGPVREIDAPVGQPAALRTMSPPLERELVLLGKMARSRLPIVVRGDSGTGKELVASAIHELSGRTGPLVAVNCGAIPPTLVESELFGTRRGAFSGAEDRPGLVRNADKGTLFLDEIAELPQASQAALLRVLQDGEVLPLGAGKHVLVDVRVVAATNRPIEELLASGAFRRDLFARLRGHELRLPPLRARIEDLGLLVAALLARHAPPGPPHTLSRAAARALFLHPWSFNVRELEQVLCSAIAVTNGPEIDVEDLPFATALPEPALPAPPPDEKERLAALLEKHQGNVSAVARDLATSRSQVKRLLERNGLSYGDFKRR